MALPGADNLCIQLVAGPGELCVVLPGGIPLCVQGDIEWDDVSSLAKTALGQINTALTPLGPFFTVFDVLIAVFDCIKAVKEAFGPAPDPSKLVQCIVNLQAAIDKLISLHPAISVPKTVKSILEIVVLFLRGIRNEVQQLINFSEAIAAANLRGAELGNFELIAVGECAANQFDIELVNLNASIAPLSRLIGVVNIFLKLAGLPCMQVPLDSLSSVDDNALVILDSAIEFVELVKDAIPSLTFSLPSIPSSSDPC